MQPQFSLSAFVRSVVVDGAIIKRAIDRAGDANLNLAGAFLQIRARSMLRRRKSVSAPGQPPSVHSRDSVATLKNIRWSVAGRSLIVGPMRANQVALVDGSSKTVPELLEKGGNATIHEESYDGVQWFRRDLRRNARVEKRYRVRKAKYQPRPLMRMAFERELVAGKVLQVWENSVRAA